MADPGSRKEKRYGTGAIRTYLDQIHDPHDTGLKAAFDAPEQEGIPPIQVSLAEGRLLTLLLQMIGARRVVEIGTLAGFSALCMAKALPQDGRLWTIEYDPHHADVARQRIDAAGYGDRIEVLEGEGLAVLPQLEDKGPFDAVFIDADKVNYDAYGRWACTHLRPGGLLLGDNAYLFGDLLDESPRGQAMRRFHEEAALAFDTVCAPTPDGLLIGVKR
jgi:caffeoyl-CoA O-methyltransferase